MMSHSALDSEEQSEPLKSLLKENEELKNFALMACHDLQAPLRHIGIYIDALREGLEGTSFLESSENAYAFSVVERGAQKMTALIDNLLTLSKVEQRPLDLQQVDLNRVCAKVTATLLEGAEDKRACTIKWGRLPTVVCDREELFQVLMNLCSNGLKHQRSEGTPEVVISIIDKIDFWEFAIKDNGVGFDSEAHGNIFQPFVRLQNSSLFSGSGLGLAICQKIVKRHGGEIWVDSKLNSGSIFRFTISKHLVDL